MIRSSTDRAYPCNRGRRRGGDDETKHITPVVRRVGDVLSHVGVGQNVVKSSFVRIAVVAVSHVEIAEDDDTGFRTDAFNEFSKFGEEDGERL